MAKMLQFNDEALRSVSRGVKQLSKAVIATLGPKGRNVMIHKGFGSPLSTKDGVTVAKEIVLKDKFENMGAQLVKEASSKTSDVAGDGTTTAIVLAQEIFHAGLKNVMAGSNPMGVKRGIEKAVAKMLEALSALSIPVSTHEEVKQIASISANNDEEIGQIIASAMEKVGKDGTITIAEAKGIETSLEVVEGMQISNGFASPYFITNAEKMSAELDNCSILIVDKKLSQAKELVPLLEKCLESKVKSLLVIAEEIEGEALATLVVNKLKAGLSLCAIKAPGFGDRRKAMLQDIAILTGGTVVSEEVGLTLEQADLNWLGKAKKVKVEKETTTIIDGLGAMPNIQARIAELRNEKARATSDYDKEKLEERLAKLVGGVAVINVGAATEAALKEKKARVEDALHATRAAVAEGIVPGGGVALLRAVKSLDALKLEGDEKVGVEIIRQAAFAPAIAIVTNCTGEQQGKANLIVEKVYAEKGSYGYNGLTNEFCDMMKSGIVDPVLVTKSALSHAASVSGLLITIAAMITDKPQPKNAAGAGMPSMDGMGGMGGMGGLGGMGGMGGMGGFGGMGM